MKLDEKLPSCQNIADSDHPYNEFVLLCKVLCNWVRGSSEKVFRLSSNCSDWQTTRCCSSHRWNVTPRDVIWVQATRRYVLNQLA